jgi:hypothetical protein
MGDQQIGVVLSFILFGIASQAQHKPSISLQDTETWMAHTVNSATLAPRDSHGWFIENTTENLSHSRTSIVFGPDSEHLDAKQTGCYAKIAEITELTHIPVKEIPGKSGNEGHTMYRVLQFSLKDIDPSRVKTKRDEIDPKYRPHVVGAIVEFWTTDDKSVIRKQSAVWKVDSIYYTSNENLVSCTGPDKGCATKEASIETGDLTVDSLEFAQRFAKAFRHAVELCGGKPSAF